ncbi:hypothetical protein L0337_42845 [candidate division KSB1 bacterium]|nr:hypothetical protein [candidate division KSB1 bacterium]
MTHKPGKSHRFTPAFLDEMLAALLFDLGAVGTQQMEDRLLVYFIKISAQIS